MQNPHHLFQKFAITLESPTLLLLRLYVASIFLKSGIQKISNWDSTLFLFEYEYHVPFIPFKVAAILGTGAELILPLFIIVGVLTRLNALALFIFNIVAVASYPALTKGTFSVITAWDWLPIGMGFPSKGFEDHVVWGLLLLTLMAFGAGKISLDQFFQKK